MRYLPERDTKYVWGLVVGGVFASVTRIGWWSWPIIGIGVLLAIVAINYLLARRA